MGHGEKEACDMDIRGSWASPSALRRAGLMFILALILAVCLVPSRAHAADLDAQAGRAVWLSDTSTAAYDGASAAAYGDRMAIALPMVSMANVGLNGTRSVDDSQLVDLTVVNEWVGDYLYNRPGKVSVQLLQDGYAYHPDPKEKDGTQSLKGQYGVYTWTDLPAGHEYALRVNSLLLDYEQTVTVDTNAAREPEDDSSNRLISYRIESKYVKEVPEKTDLAIVCDWVNKDEDAVFDPVTVRLICDDGSGEGGVQTFELNQENDFSVMLRDLEGDHMWTVERVTPVPDGYRSDIVMNWYAIETKSHGMRGYVVCSIANGHDNVFGSYKEEDGRPSYGSSTSSSRVVVRKVWFDDGDAAAIAKRPQSISIDYVDHAIDGNDKSASVEIQKPETGSIWKTILSGSFQSYDDIIERVEGDYISKVVDNGVAVHLVVNIAEPSDKKGSLMDSGWMDYVMPATGGVGSVNVILVGVMVMAGSLIAFVGRRRRGD